MKPSLNYLLNTVISSPQEGLFGILVFILSVSLDATPLQITFIACAKPITSLVSYYLSFFIVGHPHRVKKYLILNNLLGSLPCLLFPFLNNVWLFILAYIFHMVTKRAVYPAWVEYLKRNIAKDELSQLFSKGTSIFYLINTFLPPIVSVFLDEYDRLWRYVFVLFGLFHLLNIGIVLGMKNPPPMVRDEVETERRVESVWDPLKNGWKLLRTKPELKHYLLIYALGGVGIMATQPLLPTYFKETLHLSYKELTLAFSFCRGVAFISASPYWAKLVRRVSLFTLNSYMNIFTSLYFILLWCASLQTEWVYAAYCVYGAMQASTELSWNLSGPILSKESESTIYSSLNLAAIGIRGCICPMLGYVIYTYTNITCAFAFAFVVCLFCVFYGQWSNRRYHEKATLAIEIS